MTWRGHIETALQAIWRGERRWWSPLLRLLSLLYGVGARVHRLLHSTRILRVDRLDVPVISVGNLIVGGAGKTPVTLELARRFLAVGRRVAVVSRGYGRQSASPLVVVSNGEAVGATAAECGDEPLWLASKLPGLIVVVGANRKAAGATAIDLGADLILLDDGFSHHRLARTIDVLVVNGDGALGNRRLLPAGPLREPLSSARRAGLIWLSRSESESAQVPARLPALPAVRSSYEASRLVSLNLESRESVAALRERRVLAVCGIARPEGFRQVLVTQGAIVRDMLAYPDHHPFTQEDVVAMERLAQSERCELIVTTEKDAMRLAPLTQSPLFRAVEMETKVIGDTSALDALIRRFAAPVGSTEVA